MEGHNLRTHGRGAAILVGADEKMDNMEQGDSWRNDDSVDFGQLANYTISQRVVVEEKMNQLEIGPELRTMVRTYLENQGYEVVEEAKLVGRSGIEHTFDMLAQKDDGFTKYDVAVCILLGGDRNVEVGTIFSFANKAYDTNTQGRALIAIPSISPEARKLAQKQRIKVIESEKITLAAEMEAPGKPEGPFRFENSEQLAQSLTELGYSVERDAKVNGRSGVEYTFDILAFTSTDQVGQSLGIDYLSGNGEVSLEQVALFDTKSYEVGVDFKVVVVWPKLSPEAEQFAQHQRIKILELSEEPAPEPALASAPAPEPTVEEAPAEKPAKAEKKAEAAPPSSARQKNLKQATQPEALQLIPEVMARRYNAVPLSVSGNTLQLAMADPTDIFALEAFSALSKMRIKPVAATAQEVREAIDFNYKGYGEIEKQLSLITMPTSEAGESLSVISDAEGPLVQALNLIVEEAVKARASDIHIEPEEDRLRVRYRIDGTLQDLMSLPLNVHLALISRIKILSNLNIADRHRAQDGQFSVEAKGRDIDIRVATTPTVSGEMAVLRLLDKSLATLSLSELGMLPDCMEKNQSMLKTPYGMILTSGPTGAGKTTTMYASINSLDCLGRNIITIEDPAEYRFKDVNQIQVNPQAGITFATGLRSILRLDPDVILVGEIRDAETANIAVQAALTGHLMLSSVHSQDAAGVLSRLLDLHIEPFLVASAVIGVIGQRMVRRVCPDCSHIIEAPLVEQKAYEREIGEKQTEFLYGTGCKSCAYTGYLGRTGIFEILLVSDQIRTLVTSRASSSQIRTQAIKEGMVPMITDGMQKVQAKITTPAEVLRSAYSPD